MMCLRPISVPFFSASASVVIATRVMVTSCGTTGSTLRVQINEENRDYFWRVSVDNISWKNPPVVQTEPTLEAAEPAAAEPVEPAEAAETGAQE